MTSFKKKFASEQTISDAGHQDVTPALTRHVDAPDEKIGRVDSRQSNEVLIIRKNKNRDSNFELLRIIAIIAIIGYHFYIQTPAKNIPLDTFSHFYAMFCGSFGRPAVNIFIMIGAWYLLDIPFKSARIVRLYLTTIFYTVFVSGGVLLFSHPDHTLAFKDMIRAFFPFTASPLWFISCYLFLLLLSPFLNVLVRNLDQKSYRYLTGLLLLIFSVIPTVANLIPGLNTYEFYIVKSDMGWFVALYLIVGYLKKYSCTALESQKVILRGISFMTIVCIVLCLLDCFLPKFVSSAFIIKKSHAFFEYLFFDLASIFSVLWSILVFKFFSKLKFSNAIVNAIAKQTLGVYILHQIPVLIPLMWGCFHINNWICSPLFFLYEPVVILLVFFGCWSIDYLRSRICNFIPNKGIYPYFTHKWDSFLSNMK